jgi:hypothetical protein
MLGATRANDFCRQSDECGQAGGGHASSRTDPDTPERLTGIYGSDAFGGALWLRDGADHRVQHLSAAAVATSTDRPQPS